VDKINREVIKQYPDVFSDCKIKIFSIAASSMGYKYIKDNGINCSVEKILKRGISDYEDNYKDKIIEMKKIESAFSASYDGVNIPSLGYGEVEALYGRERGNVPNNVFPIFWWTKYKNNSIRKTLLIRLMSEA